MGLWTLLALIVLIVFLTLTWSLFASASREDAWAERMDAEITAAKRQQRREGLRRRLRREPLREPPRGPDPP